eukprot:4481287-Alexandrium_andersonii.AAC.1
MLAELGVLGSAWCTCPCMCATTSASGLVRASMLGVRHYDATWLCYLIASLCVHPRRLACLRPGPQPRHDLGTAVFLVGIFSMKTGLTQISNNY